MSLTPHLRPRRLPACHSEGGAARPLNVHGTVAPTEESTVPPLLASRRAPIARPRCASRGERVREPVARDGLRAPASRFLSRRQATAWGEVAVRRLLRNDSLSLLIMKVQGAAERRADGPP